MDNKDTQIAQVRAHIEQYYPHISAEELDTMEVCDNGDALIGSAKFEIKTGIRYESSVPKKPLSLEEYLDRYKAPFLHELAEATRLYMLIGMSTAESPMWFQLVGLTDDEKQLEFRNSQRQGIWIKLEIEEETRKHCVRWVTVEYTRVYEYFKKVKYDYLKEHAPTVYAEIKR